MRKTFNQISQSSIYREDDVAVGITCCGGTYGVGSIVLVVSGGDMQEVYDWHRQDTRMTKLQNICTTVSAVWGSGGNNMPYVMKEGELVDRYDQTVVRRLTPVECERLQGFPDNWTDIGAWTDSKGKLHKESSDSARYKALGNSIATPFWFSLLRKISAQYERPATLGSLFDGIGGFPYCWEKCNGKGTAIWASEIEEFPIAVTKARFPEDE